MFKTKNDLPETTRVKAIELLNARLADCIDLQTQTKQAHWNVKGPNFIALHELFDKINEEVEEYVDDIAERAVQLGGVADGTARIVAKRIVTAPNTRRSRWTAASHVEALSSALAVFGKAARRAIDGGQRLRRPGHGRPVHGGLARHRQIALVRRGAPAGRAMTWKSRQRWAHVLPLAGAWSHCRNQARFIDLGGFSDEERSGAMKYLACLLGSGAVGSTSPHNDAGRATPRLASRCGNCRL